MRKHATPKSRAKRPRFPRRMTAEERRDFVLGWCNGTVYSSAQIPEDLLSLIFMPLGLGALRGWGMSELKRIGLIWADTARDETVPGRGLNGYPMFLAFRIMRKDDWDELRPQVNAELKRRKNLRP